MKDALMNALVPRTDAATDRILAESFFRTRQIQAGTVVRLEDRRAALTSR